MLEDFIVLVEDIRSEEVSTKFAYFFPEAKSINFRRNHHDPKFTACAIVAKRLTAMAKTEAKYKSQPDLICINRKDHIQ